jgi:type VI secretion system FHA domain protein
MEPEVEPAMRTVLQPAVRPAPAPVPAGAAEAPSAVRPAAGRAPAPASPDSDSRVLQALLRGLGLPDLHSRRDAEELAELAGAMLREATAGTIGILMARTLTKRESRVEMTMIAPQANNPLKFFPDSATALTHMLQGPLPGYLPPEEAFAGAFLDLRAHELAVMAGTRAALAGVLRRFDPAAIEERLREPGLLEKVFTSSRKTRMWDQLVELYGQLAVEADEDFQRLFGEAFASAYEEQVRRLRDAGH